MERDALEDDINHRNFEGTDYFCTVEHIYIYMRIRKGKQTMP